MIAYKQCLLVQIVFLTFFLHFNVAIIPRECADELGKPVAKCCPIPNGFLDVCGGYERGSCQRIDNFILGIPWEYFPDNRLNWPTQFFHYGCKCKGHYFGVGCNRCRPGWMGTDCLKKAPTQIRRNIKDYSKKEKELFLKVLNKSFEVQSEYMIFNETGKGKNDLIGNPELRNVSVYEMIVFVHTFATKPRCTRFGKLGFAHEGQAFIFWHRYFMLFWEYEFNKIANIYFGIKNFTLPYWDWTDKDSCEICTDDFLGNNLLNDPQEPKFSNWVQYCKINNATENCVVCENPNKIERTKIQRFWKSSYFPETADLKYALSFNTISNPKDIINQSPCFSFRNAFEGFCGIDDPGRQRIHNQVHQMINGTFSFSSISPSDPIFIFHHTQMDRFFQKWFMKSKWKKSSGDLLQVGMKIGHCRECNLVGFYPIVKLKEMYVSSEELGYTYDDFNFGKLH